MTMRVVNMLGGKPGDDARDKLPSLQREHAAKVDPKDSYITDKVKVVLSVGGTDTTKEVVVRSQTNGRYIFVTAHENQVLVDSSSDETWRSLGYTALNKFAATRNRVIIFGPRPEDTNSYNFMAELQALPKEKETANAE